MKQNELNMSLQAQPNCASLLIRSTRGVDLMAWPGEEWVPLMLCMADCNNEKPNSTTQPAEC